MSRVFKSTQCIESNPCKLETIEVNILADPQAGSAGMEFEGEEPLFSSDLSEESSVEDLIEQAQLKAKEILEEARKESEQIKTAAVLEAEQLKADSERNGFEQGRAAGLAAIKAELAGHLEFALNLLNEAEIFRSERIAASEPELLRLAVAVAEKVIATELQTNGQAIEAIVRAALSKVAAAGRIKVRLRPEDLELLSALNQLQFDEVLSEPKPIQFEADPTIKNGGCFIETEMGNVDSRIKIQCERIITELLKVGHL